MESIKLRKPTRKILGKFFKLVKKTRAYRKRDIYCNPKLEHLANKAIKAFAKDLFKHAGLKAKNITSLKFHLINKSGGRAADEASCEVIVEACDGHHCEYGVHDYCNNVSYSIGSGVQE